MKPYAEAVRVWAEDIGIGDGGRRFIVLGGDLLLASKRPRQEGYS
jgi:hypothetical protein